MYNNQSYIPCATIRDRVVQYVSFLGVHIVLYSSLIIALVFLADSVLHESIESANIPLKILDRAMRNR